MLFRSDEERPVPSRLGNRNVRRIVDVEVGDDAVPGEGCVEVRLTQTQAHLGHHIQPRVALEHGIPEHRPEPLARSLLGAAVVDVIERRPGFDSGPT